MWESVGTRGPRPVLWRLVLITVLAGLLHVLGCAHGPQFSGAVPADTVTGAASYAQEVSYAPEASPVCTHGADAGCAGDDEPAASTGRTDLPLPALGEGLSMPWSGAGPWGQEGSAAVVLGSSPGDRGRARAVLGVWRT
ncbi:hypothetical protein ACIO3O_14235 [Streptomyces sp. NPDC087440]|uniref:hypothetical protein n=1 Tax=Streptomyces sp. NPDC087440 TaxID=3365790 RepID=UPI003820A4E4